MNMILKDEYIAYTVPRQKNIALIAHDGKKEELIRWCEKNKDVLARHFLSGTGTTARLVAERTGLPVKAYNSGPLGGDQQIGAKIVEGKIDIVIFFSDPLAAQPHDPDVKALLRIAQAMTCPWRTTRQARTTLSIPRCWERNMTATSRISRGAWTSAWRSGWSRPRPCPTGICPRRRRAPACKKQSGGSFRSPA